MSFEKVVKLGAEVKTISGPNRTYGVGRDEYMRKATYKGRIFYSDIRKRKSDRPSKQRVNREYELGLRRTK